jgi:hypothetical protein
VNPFTEIQEERPWEQAFESAFQTVECLTCGKALPPGYAHVVTGFAFCESCAPSLRVLKTCQPCGRGYTGPEWARLPLAVTAESPNGMAMGLEWRNCPCGGTMVLEVV